MTYVVVTMVGGPNIDAASFYVLGQSVLSTLADLHRIAPRATLIANTIEEDESRNFRRTPVDWVWRRPYRVPRRRRAA